MEDSKVEDYVGLKAFSKPINEFLEDPTISEICINRPGEAWVEKGCETFFHKVPELTYRHLETFIGLVADFSEQHINKKHPLLSASMPNGYRIQAVIPPATLANTVVISIRKQTVVNLTIDDYEKSGAFNHTQVSSFQQTQSDDFLCDLLRKNKIREFCEQAVLTKKNIIVSGSTGSGKTTFLNALIKDIPDTERLITIEDVDEIRLTQKNHARLFFSRGGQGKGQHTTSDLLRACLRLNPNRIMFGELRGEEAIDYLESINTAHPGSITTVHANNPESCLERLIVMTQKGNFGLSYSDVKRYVQSIVDVIIQINPIGGRREITGILYKGLKRN